MTDIIVSLKLPSFYTVLHNARVRFCAQSSLSCNEIVLHFNALVYFNVFLFVSYLFLYVYVFLCMFLSFFILFYSFMVPCGLIQ